VQAAVGRPFPDDLRQWWQQADGAVRVSGVYLLPWGFAPMSCRDALEDRAGRLEIEAETSIDDEDLDDEDLDDEDPGEYFGFHPHYLPIGDDHCGNCLYVDLRDGPEYGLSSSLIMRTAVPPPFSGAVSPRCWSRFVTP
jgi:cell wall assembly regulator SMI1